MTNYQFIPRQMTEYLKDGDYLGDIQDINYNCDTETFSLEILLFNILSEDDEYGNPKELNGEIFVAKFHKNDVIFNNFAYEHTDNNGFLDYDEIINASIEISVKTINDSSLSITRLTYSGKYY